MALYPHLSWRKPADPEKMRAALAQLLTPDPEAWQAQAGCAETDPELFFPERGGASSSRTAKGICAECPVRVQCLQYALDNEEEDGVWGGTTPDERRILRGRRQRGRGRLAA